MLFLSVARPERVADFSPAGQLQDAHSNFEDCAEHGYMEYAVGKPRLGGGGLHAGAFAAAHPIVRDERLRAHRLPTPIRFPSSTRRIRLPATTTRTARRTSLSLSFLFPLKPPQATASAGPQDWRKFTLRWPASGTRSRPLRGWRYCQLVAGHGSWRFRTQRRRGAPAGGGRPGCRDTRRLGAPASRRAGRSGRPRAGIER